MPKKRGFLKPEHERLNVIQIMMDQLPWYALGCYGHPLIKTPNIDKLAAQGVRFTQAYAQSTICCPSRASQLTGLYPSNHGIMSNNNNLETMNPHVRFLSDRFYEDGYTTGHFGKWHCLRPANQCAWTEFRFLEDSVPIWPQSDLESVYGTGDDPNFVMYGGMVHAATHPCDEDATGPARITDWSVDFIERFAYTPFFLRVSYLGPHAPVLTPAPFDTMYDPDDIELPEWADLNLALEEFANRPEPMRKLQERTISMREESNRDGMTSEEAIRIHIAYELGLVSHIDDQIGRILDTLEEMELQGQTLVMFTTDHGSFWGEHGLLEKSGNAHYRNLLQLPTILSCPGVVPQGEDFDGLVEEVDFFPTLLDFAGIEQRERINGRSRKVEILHQGGGNPREDMYAEFSDPGTTVASLRTEQWTFIWHGNGECELYDRQADPHERFNLAGETDYADVVKSMTTRLLTRRLNNTDVVILPPDHAISRSPIYLTPGHSVLAHDQAMRNRRRGMDVPEF